MAQTTGFTCDFCGGFQVGVKASNGTFGPPAGWMTLKVRSEREATEGERPKDNLLDICSNLCLTRLAAARYEAETGENYGTIARREYQKEWRKKKASDG